MIFLWRRDLWIRLETSCVGGVFRRLEFIEFRLLWYGHFTRRDMAEAFGISAQQASVDIRQYDNIAPNNLAYDRSVKAYRRTDTFRPAFIGKSIDQYLMQLVAIENRWMRQEDTWFGILPTVDAVTLGGQPIDSTVMLRVLEAMRSRLEIEIEYASLTGSTEAT